MFDFFRRQNTKQPQAENANKASAEGGSETAYEAWVIWPNRERERFVVDPARLDAKGLTGAKNWLTILSLNGSFMRASTATGRAQTLTAAAPSSAGPPLAVRIAGDSDKPLATVAVFGARHDAATVKAALKIVADDAKVAVADLDAIVSQSKTANGMVIATFGAKDDAAVDEAYGMALHLGAAMNESPAASDQSNQVAAPPPIKSGLPIGEVTLEQLAILHQRSAFILCGMAPGSCEQAQAWDDWLERYRLPSQADGMNLLGQAGAENVVTVNLFVDKAFWGELRTMPYRFAAIQGSVAGYAIPWDGENVPDINDFTPDPSKGPRQAAAAALAGQVERLKS
jgi:hypothetical protein